MLSSTVQTKPLTPQELVTDRTLHSLARGGPERQQGIISLQDQAILAMVLPDIMGELLAYRASERMLRGTTQPKETPKANRLLDQDLSTLDVSIRCRAALRGGGINSLRDLVQTSEATIIALPHLNREAILQLKMALIKYGLRLDMKLPAHLRSIGGPV